MKLCSTDIVLSSRLRTDRAFIVGSMFGPMVLCVGGTAEEALDIFHGAFCDPVEADDPALADCGGLEGALAEGSVVSTEAGFRWADHYVWLKEFTGKDAVRRAGRYWRNETYFAGA